MTLSKNIRYLRKKKNLSQDYMAEKLGYKSYTTIQKWEMGTSEPPLKKLKELADLFSVDIDELAKSDMENEQAKARALKSVRIPILNEIVAGMPIDAYEDIIGYEEISKSLADTGEFFALKVKGDSMLPKLENGDIVIVRRQSCVESGDIAIVLVGDEATVKKVQKSETGITLIAYNPTVYEPHTYSNEEINQIPIKIMGKVVESKRSY